MPSNTNLYQAQPSTITLNAKSGDLGLDNAIYVSTIDSLGVYVITSMLCQIGIDIRLLTVNNQLQYLNYSVNPSSTYTVNQFKIRMPEGFLIAVSAYTNDLDGSQFPVAVGQVFVWLEIIVPTTAQTSSANFLGQGYVTDNQRVAWPVMQTPNSYFDGYPFTRNMTLSSDGVNYQYFTPPHAVDEIAAITFNVQTSAVVGPRGLILNYAYPQSNPIPITRVVFPPLSPPLDANIFASYNGAQGLSYGVNGTYSYAPLPQRMRLGYSYGVGTQLTNAQTGDKILNATVSGNEWLMP